MIHSDHLERRQDTVLLHPKELSNDIKHSLSSINEIYREYYKKKTYDESQQQQQQQPSPPLESKRRRRRMDMIIKHFIGHSKIHHHSHKSILHQQQQQQQLFRSSLTKLLNVQKFIRNSKKPILLLLFVVSLYTYYYYYFKFNHSKNKISENIISMKKITKHFSLIEILIAISILVTFSGMTSMVYNEKLIESKIAYTRIELNLILQHVYLYYTTHGRYPISLNDIENLKTIASFEDRWDQPYIYIPYIDWVFIIELLQKSNVDEKEVNYQLECLQTLIHGIVSSHQIVSIDPRIILVETSQRPMLFSFGYRKPIFADSFDEQSNMISSNEFRERIQLVAQWIKIAREKSVS